MPVSREHVPEIGGEIWLEANKGNQFQIRKRRFIGETSRSWLTGSKFRPEKWPKKDYKPISEQQAATMNANKEWVFKHRACIAERIRIVVTDIDLLRQIAALIGYEEGK